MSTEVTGKSSLKTKLLSLLLGVGIVPAVVIAIIAFVTADKALNQAGEISKEALQQQVFNNLGALRENKRKAVDSYFQTIHDQILTFSENRMVVNAMMQFRVAFPLVNDEMGVSAADLEEMRKGVRSYYSGDFSAEYNAQNGTKSFNIDPIINQLDDESID